jgi:hypothetical protein
MAPRAGKRIAVLWLALVAATAAPAGAQHGIRPPEDRPLHERLAAARLVAIATVAEVGESRILLEDATAVVGSAPASFELKRAPSKPPPWVVGDRAVLLLAGARSPYVWVDRPVEAIALADAAAERRVAAALRAMDAARVDPTARRDLYARWSDGRHEDLAALGLRGLMDVPGMAGVLDAGFATARAAVASDAERSLPVRRRAARVAARHPAGVAALLRHVEETAPDTDVEIARIAIQAGLLTRDPAVEPRLVDLLAAPDGDLGRVGLELAAFAHGTEVERRLSELAVGHPDEAVRDGAVHALQRMRRNRPRAQRDG